MSTTNPSSSIGIEQSDVSLVDFCRDVYALREQLLGITNIAAALVDRADQLLAALPDRPDHPQPPASHIDPAGLTFQQSSQLRSMREAGWEVSVVGRVEGDHQPRAIVVEGCEPNGDPYTGQINPEGGFIGEPNDPLRSGQRFWRAPQHDRGGAASGPNGAFR